MPANGWLWKAIAKKMAYIDVDDSLIVKYGGVEEMDVEEVRLALIERGM